MHCFLNYSSQFFSSTQIVFFRLQSLLPDLSAYPHTSFSHFFSNSLYHFIENTASLHMKLEFICHGRYSFLTDIARYLISVMFMYPIFLSLQRQYLHRKLIGHSPPVHINCFSPLCLYFLPQSSLCILPLPFIEKLLSRFIVCCCCFYFLSQIWMDSFLCILTHF